MGGPTEKELLDRLNAAYSRVPRWSRWRHHRTLDVYEVTAVTLREADAAPLVSYRRPSSSLIWTRPLDGCEGAWLDEAAPGVPRFDRVDAAGGCRATMSGTFVKIDMEDGGA